MADSQVSTYRRENEARFASEGRRGRNQQDCALCGRSFIQDSFDRVWYWSDDVDAYGFENLSYSKAIDPFETPRGWVCSKDCWNENCAEEEVIVPLRLFLVRRPA